MENPPPKPEPTPVQPTVPPVRPGQTVTRPENPQIKQAEATAVEEQGKRSGPTSVLTFIGRFLLEVVKTAVIIIVVALLIRTFLIQPFIVEGESMEPNFHSNEYLIIEKMSLRFKVYHRGDVIIFKSPESDQINYIKRVIGLPGETVEVRQGRVYIYNQQNPNGFQLSENYLAAGTTTITDDLVFKRELGTDQYFVLGDNRDNSSDSREWGLLDKSKIEGKVVFTALPISDFGILHLPPYQTP